MGFFARHTMIRVPAHGLYFTPLAVCFLIVPVAILPHLFFNPEGSFFR